MAHQAGFVARWGPHGSTKTSPVTIKVLPNCLAVFFHGLVRLFLEMLIWPWPWLKWLNILVSISMRQLLWLPVSEWVLQLLKKNKLSNAIPSESIRNFQLARLQTSDSHPAFHLLQFTPWLQVGRAGRIRESHGQHGYGCVVALIQVVKRTQGAGIFWMNLWLAIPGCF